LHTGIQPGSLVSVRGRPWNLRALVSRDDCQELHLEPAAGHPDASPGRSLVLLAPFDRPVPLARPGRIRPVSRRGWMAALRSAVLGRREPGGLVAAALANVDVHPYQLEPALAVVCRGARRLLLADAVGLGKTIEAGLVLAELRARAALDRALVLAPSGLCDQWREELSGRFGLDAVVADSAWIRALRAVLPASLNPWSIPGVRVASIDYVKRAEVRRSLERVTWDALVVDEAHGASGDSQRRAAAQACAARSRVVLLLTATPHSGDARAFRALCAIGALSAAEPLVMFRRGRADAGLAGCRRVHLHPVRGAPAEIAVRLELDDYVRAVWARRSGPEGRDARLAMIVLLKRSLSGMGPLRRSLMARLDRLGAGPAAPDVQLPLPLDGDVEADAEPAAVLGAPGFDDPREERRVLAALAGRAAFAEPRDSKRRALQRVLRRIREPAIVFTEYRDTLDSLRTAAGPDAAVLHGGMDRFERSAAVARFTAGGARVLLATDAAGEGLNLQSRCRTVINLELPWSPMRLEQRVGRVDRIGQRRTVHAINLLASGTAESEVLARLVIRLDRAAHGVGPLDDVLGLSDEALASACLGAGRRAMPFAARPGTATPAAMPHAVRRIDLEHAARDQAVRLDRWRRLLGARRGRGPRAQAGGAPRRGFGISVTAVRCSRLALTDGRTGLLVLFRIVSAAPVGTVPDEDLVPVFAEGPCPPLPRRRDVRAAAAAAMETLVPRMAGAIPRAGAAGAADDGTAGRDALLASRTLARRPVQRGLFERRALREAEETEASACETRLPAAAAPGSRRAAGAHAEPASQPVLLLFVTP
jgi:superfamily II DNA or RNA helicase